MRPDRRKAAAPQPPDFNKKSMSQAALQRKKLQQRIHREQLKLARLKTKANKARSEDARLKLRLGGFLFLLDWQDLELDILSDRIQKIAADLTEIDSETQERFKILGENTLRLLVRDREYDPASPGLSSDDRSCLLYTSPSPRDRQKSRMPSSA